MKYVTKLESRSNYYNKSCNDPTMAKINNIFSAMVLKAYWLLDNTLPHNAHIWNISKDFYIKISKYLGWVSWFNITFQQIASPIKDIYFT